MKLVWPLALILASYGPPLRASDGDVQIFMMNDCMLIA